MRDKIIKELGISEETAQRASKAYADLKIQAMMFDMDIDIETWSLVPKSNFRQPPWIEKWREQHENGDNQPEFNVDLE